MSDATDTTAETADKPKRGRPKGLGRVPGSGRQRGTPNRNTAQTRERIAELGDPVKFLTEVMNGKRMTAAGNPGDQKKTWAFPTVAQRIQAGEMLLKRLVPELRSQEITGDPGKPITMIERIIVRPGSEAAGNPIPIPEKPTGAAADSPAVPEPAVAEPAPISATPKRSNGFEPEEPPHRGEEP